MTQNIQAGKTYTWTSSSRFFRVVFIDEQTAVYDVCDTPDGPGTRVVCKTSDLGTWTEYKEPEYRWCAVWLKNTGSGGGRLTKEQAVTHGNFHATPSSPFIGLLRINQDTEEVTYFKKEDL